MLSKLRCVINITLNNRVSKLFSNFHSILSLFINNNYVLNFFILNDHNSIQLDLLYQTIYLTLDRTQKW